MSEPCEAAALVGGGVERVSAALLVGGFGGNRGGGVVDADGEDGNTRLAPGQLGVGGVDAGFVEPTPPPLARRVQLPLRGLVLFAGVVEVGLVVLELLLGAAQFTGAVLGDLTVELVELVAVGGVG